MMNKSEKQGALWLRDPLRAAMTAHVTGAPLCALGAVLCAAFYAAALVLCGEMQGVQGIALAGTLGVALLMLGAWRALRGKEVIVLLCALWFHLTHGVWSCCARRCWRWPPSAHTWSCSASGRAA